MENQLNLTTTHPDPEFERSIMRSIAYDVSKDEFVTSTVGIIAHNLHTTVERVWAAVKDSDYILSSTMKDAAHIGNIELWLRVRFKFDKDGAVLFFKPTATAQNLSNLARNREKR